MGCVDADGDLGRFGSENVGWNKDSGDEVGCKCFGGIDVAWEFVG